MPNLEFALGDVRSRKNLVYSRQKKANPKSAHVQESNSSPSNEVTISNFLALQSETEAQITEKRPGPPNCPWKEEPENVLNSFISYFSFSII